MEGIYGKLIKSKFEEKNVGKIGVGQAGLTAGRTSMDSIYTVQQLIANIAK